MLSDEDKKEIERMLRDRQLKLQMWWLEKLPFFLGGIFVGIMILSIATCCSPHIK
jgi:hypothetical protein